MKHLFIPLLLLLLTSCATGPKKPRWITESDQIAEEFTRDFAQITPEIGSGFGYKEYDRKGSNPTIESKALEIQKLKAWKKRLETKLKTVRNKNLQVDFGILLEVVNRDLEWKRIDMKIGSIPIPQASRSIYTSLFQLSNSQAPLQRKKDSVDRFKFYMSEKNKMNIVQAYAKLTKAHEKLYKKQKKFYPFSKEIEKYLTESNSYVMGVEQILKQSGRTDWKDEFNLFTSEIKKYDDYIKKKLLVKTRKTPNLPLEVYKLHLKQVGVKTTPNELIRLGKKDYKKLYQKFKKLAHNIGKTYNLKNRTPLAVINHLKTKKMTKPKEVEKIYNATADRLESIIRTNKIATLPEKKLRIRLAGEAESKSSPVPHVLPPPLIDNDGVVPEFVVPTSKSGALPFDDFSYVSAAAILTIHEGRPGHDLQFSRMLDIPISIVRARYAMNSVNAEGWAVYAEDLIYPYLTKEEQMVATQMRLWRIARYFLDPMVQLGLAKKNEVTKVFYNELGVSKVMAGLEFDRYGFRLPGQATAYYEGLLNIRRLKKDLTKKYGSLNEQCFNDTLLSFGLLPHDKVRLFFPQFKACATKLD